MSYLEVKNIYKNFGDTEVLKGINFTLEKGEVLAIIGASGSGKSTLLRCLNFLETPDKGEIFINNEQLFNAEDLDKIKDKSIRAKRLHFGLVFQSFNLFPHYNILKNVSLASKLLANEEIKAYHKSLKNNLKKLDKEAKKAEKKLLNKKLIDYKDQKNLLIEQNAKNLLIRVGLKEKMSNYPFELSGGQQQRVAIARALALNPDILCFDEPTSALDPELTGEVLKVIKGLKSSDSTMIIVTHEMAFAKNVADKVIFMAEGVVEEVGTAEEVFNNSKREKTKAFLSKSLENTLGD